VWLHHLGAREPSGGHGSYFGLKPGCSNATVHNGFERLMGVPSSGCLAARVRLTAAGPPRMKMCPCLARPSYTSMADESGLICGSGSDVGGGSAGECHHKRAEIT
jgi:hypothetical protein